MTDPQPDWDAAALKWKDWSNPAEVKWTAAPQATIPAVCSSLVWQAVRNANLAGSPKIHLDWAATQADALGEAGGRCRRELQPDWSGDNRDDFTLDGLYFYDEASRSKAGSWLNDHLSQQVYDGLKQALGDKGGAMKIIADAIDDVGRGSFIAAAEAGTASLMALLTPLVGPVVAGILDAIMAEQLIELLYDMPDDIANQVCNSFAFDCHRGFPGDTHCVDAVGNEIRDIDSTNWSDAPGVGRAVSPDNIHMFWDAPNPSGSPKIVQGLYGYNTPVQLVAAVVRRPKCVCKKSTGTATIKGFVRMNGKPVAGAYVKVNCQHTISTTKPGYSLTVQSGGQYKVVARYEDPATGLVMYGERTTDPDITPGQVISSFDITVISPPTCLRNVIVGGTVRVDDVGTFGADHAETPFTTTLHVQYGVATFNEAKGAWDVDPDDPAAIARRSDVVQVGASTGDANGQLKIEVTANKGLDVDVTVTGTIGDLSHQAVKNVPDGATVTIDEFDLDTGGPFNDRAYFRGITITNIPAQAI
jgi:hypothetical protein